VAREVLAGGRHTRRVQTINIGTGETRHPIRIAAQRAITDHLTATVIKIENRRKAEIDTTGQHLGRHYPGSSPGHRVSLRVIHRSDVSQRGQPEYVTAQALNAPAFLVYRNQHVRALLADGPHQLGDLARRFCIARKQDQAGDFRLTQQLPVLCFQPQARQIQHQGTLFQYCFS
jgi:hypothetical protein